jgi:tetratricopeptide (TPR) repeat protein
MRSELAAYIKLTITVIIFVIVGLTPLLFLPFTTEFFEIPKLIFLVTAVLILLLLWATLWIVQGKVTFTKTPLDIPIVLFVIVALISAFFSDSRYITIFGSFPRVSGSLISIICYALLYFIISSNLRKHDYIKGLFYTLLTSSLLVTLVTLMSYFKLFLPINFANQVNFTPTGGPFSTVALLILLLPFTLVSIITPTKLMPRWFGVVLASLFILTIILVGNIPIYIATAVVVALTIFTQNRNILVNSKTLTESASSVSSFRDFAFAEIPQGPTLQRTKSPNEKIVLSISSFVKKWLPWIVIVAPIFALIVLVLSVVPLGKVNVLNSLFQNYPREVQLPLADSWKVSAGVFRDNPFFGTGPSTYLYNFTQYKPATINNTSLWNIRFDQGFNEYLQIFGTLGLLGLLALIFLVLVIIGMSWKKLTAQRSNPESSFIAALALSSITIAILFAFHTSTIVLMVTGIAILGMFMAITKSEDEYKDKKDVEELTIGIKASKFGDSNLVVGDVLPIILFIPIVLFIVYVAFQAVHVVKADVYHRMAIDAAATNALKTYEYLGVARAENPYIDMYRLDYANTNFALANSIAINKGPNEASPGGNLTDEDKRNIQGLLSQAIGDSQAAVAIAPRAAQNWEFLGSLYRQISGVAQDALTYSLDAYGRAIERDPYNPLLRLNVGGIYYSIRNYDQAIRFFSDAISLKPDFANGYYNLAVALQDKGDSQTAQAVAERLVSLLDPKSQDYQTATKLLADLKEKNATLSAQQAAQTSQQSSALQQDNLPDVVNLPKDQKLSTPSAFTSPKPSSSASPSPNASPQ